MLITVNAGVDFNHSSIYELADDVKRAALLADLGKQEGFEVEQFRSHDQDLFWVTVKAEADKILPLLEPIAGEGEGKVHPYYAEWDSFDHPDMEEEEQDRESDRIWERWGDKVIYELQVV